MSDPTEPTPGRRPASSGKRGRPPDLKAFLTGASKPEDALSYHELQGFLFAIVSAPDMVPPSEWVPMVLGEREPAFQDGAEAQRLLGELMQLYNDLNTQVLANAVALPSDCRFRSDLLSNFTEDAPVSQWSRGFVRGHTWLKESWKPLPDSLEDELGALLVTLSIFSSQRLAAKFVAEGAKPGKSLADLAETCRTLFPNVMTEYAQLGRCIQRAVENVQSETKPFSDKSGRNDPCPCGSGKKYKKCCLAAPADLMERAAREVRGVQNEVEPRVMRSLRALTPDFMDLAWDEFALGHEDLNREEGPQLFGPWLLYNWIPAIPGGTGSGAQRFLDEHRARLRPEEIDFLQRTSDTPLSFHEVLEVEPGRRLRLRDVLLETELDVFEQSGSAALRVGDLIYGRVVSYGSVGLIVGSGAVVLPPIEKGEPIRIRERLRRESGTPTPAMLHANAVQLRGVYLGMRERLMNPRLPIILNSDNEALEFHTITCEVDSTEAAFEALATLERGKSKEDFLRDAGFDAGGRLNKVKISWLKKEKRANGPWGETVLGSIHLEGSTLKAEVNSAARSRRLQKELRKRLGSAMRNLAIGIKPMEEALAEHKRLENTPEERERQRKEAEWRASPEVRGAMSQIQERQWEGWLDGKIPALDGLTPREAVRRPDGREMVEALLLQFERDRPPGEDAYDFNRLRRKLGLAAR